MWRRGLCLGLKGEGTRSVMGKCQHYRVINIQHTVQVQTASTSNISLCLRFRVVSMAVVWLTGDSKAHYRILYP